MANLVITTDDQRIYIAFNDYADAAGMASGNWAKEDISIEMNNNNSDVFLFSEGDNLGRLSFEAGNKLLVVDTVDGVAPISNVDLYSKLQTALEIVSGGGSFISLSDAPDNYTGDALKVVRVNAGETGLEFVALAGGGDMLSTNNLADVSNASTARTNLGLNTTANQTDSANKRFMTDAQEANLDNQSGINTGDQNLSGYSLTSHDHTGLYAPVLGVDDNYVTDAEKTKLSNLSGTNTGDQNLTNYFLKTADDTDDLTEGATKLLLTTAERTKLSNTSNTNSGDNAVNTLYSGLEASKQATLVSATNIKTINGTTILGAGNLVVSSSYTLVATLAGNQATAADVNPVTLTGLVFNYEANSKYRIWAMGRVQPTAATTGCGFQFDLSSAVTALTVQFYHQLANTGTLSGGHSIADDSSVAVSSGMPGTSTYPVTLDGLLVTTANAGTAQLRFRSETTAVTTCVAGFTLVVEKIA